MCVTDQRSNFTLLADFCLATFSKLNLKTGLPSADLSKTTFCSTINRSVLKSCVVAFRGTARETRMKCCTCSLSRENQPRVSSTILLGYALFFLPSFQISRRYSTTYPTTYWSVQRIKIYNRSWFSKFAHLPRAILCTSLGWFKGRVSFTFLGQFLIPHKFYSSSCISFVPVVCMMLAISAID